MAFPYHNIIVKVGFKRKISASLARLAAALAYPFAC
jgi:hypothetical protein